MFCCIAGMKQQLTHAEVVKATIPTLFSATRFVSYIRQKVLYVHYCNNRSSVFTKQIAWN